MENPTVKELRNTAKELGIKGYSKLNKDDLLMAIKLKEAEMKKRKEFDEAEDRLTEELKKAGVSPEVRDMTLPLPAPPPAEEKVRFDYIKNPSLLMKCNGLVGDIITKKVWDRSIGKHKITFQGVDFRQVTIDPEKYDDYKFGEYVPIPQNAPMYQYVLEGKFKPIFVQAKNLNHRRKVYQEVLDAATGRKNKETGAPEPLWVPPPEFKNKNMLLFMGRLEDWADVLGITVEEFMGLENQAKICKLLMTPSKALTKHEGNIRIMVLPKMKDQFGFADEDGPVYSRVHMEIYRGKSPKDKDMFVPYTNALQIRTLGRLRDGSSNPLMKGLLIKDDDMIRDKELEAFNLYGVTTDEYDFICTEDALKLGSFEVGKVFEMPWYALRLIGFKIRAGRSSLGRQAVCIETSAAMFFLVEHGMVENAKFFRSLCEKSPFAWLKFLGMHDPDRTMQDNKFLDFSFLIEEDGAYRMPMMSTQYRRSAARLESAWRDLLTRVRVSEESQFSGYRSKILEEAEELYFKTTGERRIFFIPSNDESMQEILKHEYDADGKLEWECNSTIIAYPTVWDMCVISAYPLREDIFNPESPIIWGPSGINQLSARTLGSMFRDGDGDKLGSGKSKVKFPVHFATPAEKPEKIKLPTPNDIWELKERTEMVADVIWQAAVAIGIIDLTVCYIYLARKKYGVPVTNEEAYEIGMLREQGIQQLKHLHAGKTASGGDIDLSDPDKIADQLMEKFGKGIIPSMSKEGFELSNKGEVEHLLLTKRANSPSLNPSNILNWRLEDLLPALLPDNMSEEDMDRVLANNPFAPMYKAVHGIKFRPNHEDADIIKAQFKTVWASAMASFPAYAEERGFQFTLDTVVFFSDWIDGFYRHYSKMIMRGFRQDFDQVRRNKRYSNLNRAIRNMTHGTVPPGLIEHRDDFPEDSNEYASADRMIGLVTAIGQQLQDKDHPEVQDRCYAFLKYCVAYLGTKAFSTYWAKHKGEYVPLMYGGVIQKDNNGRTIFEKASNAGGVLWHFPASTIISVRKMCDPNNPYIEIARDEALKYEKKLLKHDNGSRKEKIEVDYEKEEGVEDFEEAFYGVQ